MGRFLVLNVGPTPGPWWPGRAYWRGEEPLGEVWIGKMIRDRNR